MPKMVPPDTFLGPLLSSEEHSESDELTCDRNVASSMTALLVLSGLLVRLLYIALLGEGGQPSSRASLSS